MKINMLRSLLYFTAKILGDINAVLKGKIVRRVGAYCWQVSRARHGEDVQVKPIPEQFPIGSTVRYIPGHANGDASHVDCENGVVTGHGEGRSPFVFVIYHGDTRALATYPECLAGFHR